MSDATLTLARSKPPRRRGVSPIVLIFTVKFPMLALDMCHLNCVHRPLHFC
jgi:hypothetical protein